MNFEITSRLSGAVLSEWRELVSSAGLSADRCAERTVLVYDGDTLVATGARDGAILKMLAVKDSHRGEDLTSAVLTELRRDAFDAGHTHLFLYTKPENKYTFESLFFYPVAMTESVLVMENKRGGLADFLDSLPEGTRDGTVGAIVMNCDPFTIGHKGLIERASCECDRVYVFVLSEDGGEFSPPDRLNMVRLGTAEFPNVTVLPSGPYLISRATFPTYFIKDRDRADAAACEVDIEIFAHSLGPRLGITHRYVGTEPLSPLTGKYNEALKGALPEHGIEVCEIPRITDSDAPISASAVRELIKKRDTGALSRLVPKTTLDYLHKIGRI